MMDRLRTIFTLVFIICLLIIATTIQGVSATQVAVERQSRGGPEPAITKTNTVITERAAAWPIGNIDRASSAPADREPTEDVTPNTSFSQALDSGRLSRYSN